MAISSLGTFLKSTRMGMNLSLRAVEDATGGTVSNAYLSQIENGHIKKPSPIVLYDLALALGVSYERIMGEAGYVPIGGLPGGWKRMLSVDGLDEEEHSALMEYLLFLRWRKKGITGALRKTN